MLVVSSRGCRHLVAWTSWSRDMFEVAAERPGRHCWLSVPDEVEVLSYQIESVWCSSHSHGRGQERMRRLMGCLIGRLAGWRGLDANQCKDGWCELDWTRESNRLVAVKLWFLLRVDVGSASIILTFSLGVRRHQRLAANNFYIPRLFSFSFDFVIHHLSGNSDRRRGIRCLGKVILFK